MQKEVVVHKFTEDKKCLLVDETGSFYSSFSSLENTKKYINRRTLNESFSTDYYLL